MTQRPGLILSVGVWLMLALGSPAFAQDAIDKYLGQPVIAVEFRIEGRPETSPPLLALIDIKPGDRLTMEALRRVGQKLDQVPRFESVSAKIEERPEGAALVFDATPRHPVNSLVVLPSADTGLPPADLEARIREEFGGVPALTRTDDVEEAVRRILKEEGYRSADAVAQIRPYHNPDRSTMEVSVTAGPRTTIVNAVIRGKSDVDAARTLVRIGATSGAPYRERALATALAEIRDELRAKQYLTAVAQPLPPEFTEDGRGVSLVITINAGPVVEVAVVGDLPGRYDDYVQIKRANSVSRDQLENTVRDIIAGWQQKGYWRAKAEYKTENPTPDRLKVTFTVERGQKYRVRRIDMPQENPVVLPAELKALVALRPGETFNLSDVYEALGVIRGLYQKRGYHLATLDPWFEDVVAEGKADPTVIIHPRIVEGPKAFVTAIVFDLGDGAKVTREELRARMRSKQGEPFSLQNLRDDRLDLADFYERRGFLERQVVINAKSNEQGTEIALTVQVREGPQILVSEILVVGNEKVSLETIMREVSLQVGQPYSEAERRNTQNAINRLGGFRSVKVDLEAWLPGETAARVVIAVEESPTKTYEIGGGLEAGSYPKTLPEGGIDDRIIFAPRASFGFARSNIGGHNRTFTAFARFSLKPKTTDENFTPSPDYRVIGTYRERYAFGLKSDLLFSATAEQGLRTSYNFIKRVASAEFLRPVSPRVTASGRYTLEWSKRFDDAIPDNEQLIVDRLFPQVRISMFSGGIAWDRRDDPLSATRGGLIASNTDVALKAFGSEVSFIKTFAEASVFRPVIGPKRLIFAGRAQLGLARGFDPSTTPEDALDDPLRDLPASQRLFSGGSATHRGFQLDRLGADDVLTPDGLSKGGNGLVLFNAELRAHVGKLLNRDLTAVGFVDVGNVFHRVSTIDMSQLRTGVGFGIRYDSWIGPLRLDFGFKTDRKMFTGGLERRWEFHLSIGEVF